MQLDDACAEFAVFFGRWWRIGIGSFPFQGVVEGPVFHVTLTALHDGATDGIEGGAEGCYVFGGEVDIGFWHGEVGVDAVEAELTDLDKAWLTRKLTQYGLMPEKGVDHFTKIVAGKQLWNYDNLEPNEKKLIL